MNKRACRNQFVLCDFQNSAHAGKPKPEFLSERNRFDDKMPTGIDCKCPPIPDCINQEQSLRSRLARLALEAITHAAGVISAPAQSLGRFKTVAAPASPARFALLYIHTTGCSHSHSFHAVSCLNCSVPTPLLVF